MADVRGGRDRGQLILITGLLVAVAMVSLVLLLNTAIYTENVASRGIDQSGREALEYRGTMLAEVERLFVTENAAGHATWTDLNDTTRGAILSVDNYTARSHASRGTAVGITRSSLVLEEGGLVRQNDSARAFTDDSGNPDWVVVQSVEGTRNFTMTVDRSDLNETTEADAHGDGAFRIDVGGGAWVAYVYDDGSDVVLATNVSGTTTAHCSAAASEATIDLTAGTIEGVDCPGYAWADGVSTPYTIEYENGDNATGTYNLTVDHTGSTAYPAISADGTSPYQLPAIYSVSFELYYRSTTLTYRDSFRLAPGEPP